MILGVQILGVLFSLFMMYYTFLHYKKKEFTVKESGFWFLVWIAFLIVALFPQLLDPILSTLKIARTLDFLIIVGFMFIIATIIYIYSIVRINQKMIDSIVRKVAFDLEAQGKVNNKKPLFNKENKEGEP